MLDKLRLIPDKFKNWRSSIEERELVREEEDLRESVFVLVPMLGYDRKVAPLARELRKGKGRLTPVLEKELLFEAYATLYIPEDAGKNFMTLRTIFGKGSYRLFRQQTLKDLALENGMSWKDGLNYYRRASLIVSESQLKQAKLELTGNL